MKAEDAFARRVERWEKIKGHFMPMKVQESLNQALVKWAPPGGHMMFVIDPEDWLVVSWVPVFYNWYGPEQKDEAERIAYIEVSGTFLVNGKPRGPRSTLKIIPPGRGKKEYDFPDLATAVRGALSGKPVETDENDEFLLDTLMRDESAPPTTAETEALVERMTEALVEMGYSRRGAVRKASETVAKYPDNDNIDDLLELTVDGLK